MQDQQQMSRRESLLSLGFWSLAALTVPSCIGVNRNLNFNALDQNTNQDLAELRRITAKYFPDLSAALGTNVSVEVSTKKNLLEELQRSELAMQLTRELLAQKCHTIVKGINSNHNYLLYADSAIQDYVAGLSCGVAVTGEGPHQLTESTKTVRNYLAAVLRRCSGSIALAGIRKEEPLSPLEIQIIANLTTRLPIIAERIIDKSLLLSENVLHYHHKTGSTSKLIGRTDHFPEALTEIRQLIALGNNMTTGGELE